MKVLVDLLGAPHNSGGMRLYSEELIRAWLDLESGDELIVVGEQWLRESLPDHPRLTIVPLPVKRTAVRLMAKLFVVPVIYFTRGCQAVFSVSPVISPGVPRKNRFGVVHDWRHLKNPGEFGHARRLYRRLWIQSCKTSRAVFAVSAKTLKESREIIGEANLVLARNGGDHPRHWTLEDSPIPPSSRSVITFGHHSNKRPHLAIEALSHMQGEDCSNISLHVLGATGRYKAELEQLAEKLGVSSCCYFPGFVDAASYRRLISSAALIALLSSDEGFGLPAAEAAYFGVPCVVAGDSGLAEIHEHLNVVAPRAEDIAASFTLLLEKRESNSLPVTCPSWAETAMTIRSTVAAAVELP